MCAAGPGVVSSWIELYFDLTYTPCHMPGGGGGVGVSLSVLGVSLNRTLRREIQVMQDTGR
jgi:hypothetical protein